MRSVLFLLLTTFCTVFNPVSAQERVVYPKSEFVLNAKLDLGAKGDGTTDDTEALQKGIDLSSGYQQVKTKVFYIPNGTYKVSKTLIVKNSLGPWMIGESRDGVIIKLVDSAKDVTSVIRTHPSTKPPTSADWFMRNLRNFTVDVGKNPETDGIQYYATNSGMLQNIRVIGEGKVGINSGFLEQNGPCLIQDCVIEGFETGILSHWNWGQTISRVTIKNCKKAGLITAANVTAIEDITIENTPLPIQTQIPNDWYWWGGVMSIHGAKITGNFPDKMAIHNLSVLYARNIEVTGYRHAIASTNIPNRDVPGPKVDEYISSLPVQSNFDAPKNPTGIMLPAKREPVVAWETDTSKWLCANDYGVKAGDNIDDTVAIQKAFDAAAKQGKTVVYFNGCGGGDPNHYTVEGEVVIPAGVRYITGLGFGRIIGGKNGKFIVDDKSSPVVKFQNIDSFGGPPVTIENRSAKNTLVVESCGVKILGTGLGDIFATDAPCLMDLQKTGQKVWCRQLNPEGNSDDGLVKNSGADLWILGMKCEGEGVRIATKNGGRTEVFGTFIYGHGTKETDKRPIFDVDNASLAVLGLREITFAGGMYQVKVREKRGEVVKNYGILPGHGWIGWSMFHAFVPK
jgi:hypothetical protein